MKQRLDLTLVQKGLVDTRTKAQALIMAGAVRSQDKILDKPGQMVDDDIVLDVTSGSAYVSRAGEKLASVAQQLKLDFTDKVVLDVGSSTGGFTDFALQHGASKVYAVDVGTNQLAWRLRQDSRVIVMEQTDIRSAELPQLADMAVIDVSFISLRKILPAVEDLLLPDWIIVAMAKPQFEAGKSLATQYHGVIPVGEVRDMILADIRMWLEGSFEIVGEADSGITGVQGNLERFFKLSSKR